MVVVSLTTALHSSLSHCGVVHLVMALLSLAQEIDASDTWGPCVVTLFLDVCQ